MEADDQILEYLLSKTKLKTFNNAINGYQLQHIYSVMTRDLKHRFFDGSDLKCAIEMRRIFDRFQTTVHEQRAADLHREIFNLKKSLKNYPKWHPLRRDMVERYNSLVDQHNELCKGVSTLIKMYRKANKSKKQKNEE